MSSRPRQPRSPGARTAPLWASLAVVFVASLGTGVITNGVFFVAKQGGGFTTGMNYGLGVLLGLTYIVGAIGIGPALRRAAARFRWVSTRAVLLWLTAMMGVAALIPPIAFARGDDAAWSVWAAVAIYAPCSGSFWPICESYLGGGRSGPNLRRAIGRFNIFWSSAVVLSFWAMGPVLEDHPMAVLVTFGLVQIASTALVWPMGPEPGRHIEEDHEPHPPVYSALLVTFRLLLPTSCYITSVWAPYAPDLLERLRVSVAWQAPIAATWMFSRVFVFAVMERWHGWHGRWWPVVLGSVGIVGGIAMALASPLFGQGLGTPVLVVSLAALGVGNGVIYSAALYYAMEVGKGEIEAGGTHEMLIGVGYAGGPVTGLVAVGAVRTGWLGDASLNVVVLAVLGVVLAVISVLVAARVRRAARAAGLFEGE